MRRNSRSFWACSCGPPAVLEVLGQQRLELGAAALAIAFEVDGLVVAADRVGVAAGELQLELAAVAALEEGDRRVGLAAVVVELGSEQLARAERDALGDVEAVEDPG